MRDSGARRVATNGMLFALAMVFSWLEGLVTPVLGLPPGVKLGLANVVVLYSLLFLGRKSATLLVLLKAGFGVLTRGAMWGLISLAGGGLSLLIMVLLMLPKQHPSMLVLSVAGAVAHNIGQLIVVRAALASSFTLVYLPVLLVAGVIMGMLTAGVLRALMPQLHRITKKPPPPED